MSVIIRSMEMPEWCFECPLAIAPENEDAYYWTCGGNGMRVHEVSTEECRPYNCPLEELSEEKTEIEKFQRLVLDICREHAEKGEDIKTLSSICADLVIGVHALFKEVE